MSGLGFVKRQVGGTQHRVEDLLEEQPLGVLSAGVQGWMEPPSQVFVV